MKKSLIALAVVGGFVASSAMAADLPSRAPPPVYIPPPPIFTWTGVYFGVEAGDQFGTSHTVGLATGPQPNYFPNGFIGGAYSGYNYQINQFVVGIEGNVDGSTYRGSGLDTTGLVTRSTQEPASGSIRGRVGFAWDRLLIFGTGGVAIADIKNTTTFGGATDAFDTTRVGWTAGGGIEYAFSNFWTIRAQYLFSDYGHMTEFEATTTGDTITKHETDNKVTLGIAFKIGAPPPPPPPVIAKY